MTSTDAQPEGRRQRAFLARQWRLLDQRAAAVVLFAASFAIAFGGIRTFQRATTPWSTLADNDYWKNIRGIVTEHGLKLDLTTLLLHNNEHIVLIPKLIYAVNYLLTSGSNIGLIAYSVAAGMVCVILLLWLARDLLRDAPARWVLCAVLFPLAMFSAKLSHSYYFGMSGAIWLTADIFVILSAAAMAKAAKMQSVAWLLAALLAALLGLLTYSTAIYSLLVLLVFCVAFLAVPRLRGQLPWPVLVGVAFVIAATVSIWLAYRPHPRGHPAFEFDPIGLAAFVLTYLGGSISNGYWQPLMGLAILAAGVLAIRRLVAEERGYDIILWVTLFLFAPFNGLMTGIGRLGFGLKAAMSSRYQSVTVISLIAAMALVLAALPKQEASPRASRIRFVAIAAFLAMAVFFVTNNKSAKPYAKRLEQKPVAEIAWRLGIPGEQHLRAVTKATGQVIKIYPALRAAQHVPFNTRSRCEAVLGQSLYAASTVPAGTIESISTYTATQDDRSAIELSGWIVQTGEPAECLAVVDGDGVVIGAGAIGSRHRVSSADRTHPMIEWKAVATVPQNMPVCVYALFQDSTEWTPLAECQTVRP